MKRGDQKWLKGEKSRPHPRQVKLLISISSPGGWHGIFHSNLEYQILNIVLRTPYSV